MDKKDIGKFVIGSTTQKASFLMSGNKIETFDTIEDAEMTASVYDLEKAIILKIEKIII